MNHLAVAVLVAGVITWLVAGWVAGMLRRAVRREIRHLERRLLRALIAGLVSLVLFRWLRRRRASRSVPCVDLTRANYLADCPLAGVYRQGRTVGPGTCQWCALPIPAGGKRWCSSRCRITARTNHDFSLARDAALVRDGCRCVRPRCGVTTGLEVNHKTPCLGHHNQRGCWHHVEGLETLCHRHHVQVTNGQRAAGEFSRRWRWAS